MQKKLSISALLITGMTLSMFTTGCGGSATGVTSGRTGQLKTTVDWSAQSRAATIAAGSIRLTITDDEGNQQVRIVNSTETVVSFANVSEGQATVEVEAFSGENGSGNALDSAVSIVDIIAGVPVTRTIVFNVIQNNLDVAINQPGQGPTTGGPDGTPNDGTDGTTGGTGGNPDGGNPDGGNPDGGNPDGGNPGGGNPGGGNPDGGNPDGGNPDGGNPGGGNPPPPPLIVDAKISMRFDPPASRYARNAPITYVAVLRDLNGTPLAGQRVNAVLTWDGGAASLGSHVTDAAGRIEIATRVPKSANQDNCYVHFEEDEPLVTAPGEKKRIPIGS